MAEDQDQSASAAATYPKKILEYMEGFLISKVMHTQTLSTSGFNGKHLKLETTAFSPVQWNIILLFLFYFLSGKR